MKISLIICSYGRPAQLKACLEAIDTEGLADHDGELILVYTQGDTATAETMERYSVPVPFPVKIIEADRRGLSVARNAGIAQSSGEFLVFTDDDCLMTPGYIGKVITAMSTGDYGYGGGSIHNPIYHHPGTGHVSQRVILGPRILIHAGAISGGNMFFRKDIFNRLGGFREDMGASSGTAFIGAEDLEMVTRASLAGFTGILTPDALNTHMHLRTPGSAEEKETGRGYDLGRGAHYAYLMMRGIHEVWAFWGATAPPDSNRRMTLETLHRLKQEFEGAFRYLEHCLDNNIDLPSQQD